jgi:hypothetical protein
MLVSFMPGQCEKGKRDMTKTLEVITEAILNTKHPFRKVEHRPKKAQKHRYERRKINEYIRLGNGLTENPS